MHSEKGCLSAPTGQHHPSHRTQTRGERDARILLVMLQCLLEIASGSLMEWTFHMKGALSIMKFYTKSSGTRSRQDSFIPSVLELVYNFFAGVDTSLTTTGNGEEYHCYLQSYCIDCIYGACCHLCLLLLVHSRPSPS